MQKRPIYGIIKVEILKKKENNVKRFLLTVLIALTIIALCSCELLPDEIKGFFDKADTDTGVNDPSADNGKEESDHEHVWIEASCEVSERCECGEERGEPLGHRLTDATCTSESVCTVCGYVAEGMLPHSMIEATCTDVSRCRDCEYSEDMLAPHSLAERVEASTLTYYCRTCNKSMSLEKFYYLDGEGYDGMCAIKQNTDHFLTADKNGYPVIEDGHYELLNKSGELGQMQIWIPSNSPVMQGFSKHSSCVGIVAFKINALVSQNLEMKFCDTASSGDRWSKEWCITEPFFKITPPMTNNKSSVVYINGWNDIKIEKECPLDMKGFSGWIDVKIGVVLDPDSSSVILHYYIDGEYLGNTSKEMTISTGAINSIYINGNTFVLGSGMMLDDIVFGYVSHSEWAFDDHIHERLPGSCIGLSGCTICHAGPSLDNLFGHRGGTPGCDTLAICDVCGAEYGKYVHDMLPATCTAPSSCSLCGYTEGGVVSHTLSHSISESGITYSCLSCDRVFTSTYGVVLDGSGYDGMSGILNKDNFTTSGSSQLPVIKDGAYSLVNTSGKNAQLQLWIPTNDSKNAELMKSFTSDNYPVGFFSFRFRSYMTHKTSVFRMQFVDHSSGADRWSEEWCIKKTFFSVSSVVADDQTTVDLFGLGGIYLKTVDIDPETKYTDWIDVKVGIVLDPTSDQIVLHYYIDGKYITTRSAALTTATNGVNSVYVTGSTDALGSGVMLDDIAFVYSTMTGWSFDNCNHFWQNATCTEPKTCAVCLKTVGTPQPLMHTGGTATCTELAVCTRCKTPYGALKAHKFTVSSDGEEICAVCGCKKE